MRFMTLALFLLSTRGVAADNPFLGTWKLNVDKSKSSPMPGPQSMTVTFEADGANVRRIVTGTDREGKPLAQSSPKGTSIPWDGKDHAIQTPDGPPMTVAVKRISDYRSEVTVKQSGKVITWVHAVVSEDGKTMTNTINGVSQKRREVSFGRSSREAVVARP